MFKHICQAVPILATVAIITGCTVTTQQETNLTQRPLKMIFFGNSFTLASGAKQAAKMNGIPGLVQQIAKAAGFPEPFVQKSAVGGKTLEWHLANKTQDITRPRLYKGMPAGPHVWDYVILQEYSTRPTSPDNSRPGSKMGCPKRFSTDAYLLYREVRDIYPSVKVVLYETWARSPKYKGMYPRFFKDPDEFQNQLHKYYYLAAEELNERAGKNVATVAPAGDAWQKLGFARKLYCYDLYHGSNQGYLLNAMVIFSTIYKKKVSGIDLSELCKKLNISEEDCKELAKTADSVSSIDK